MTVGERIKCIRQEKRMTQKELGNKCGLADSAIRRYELGGANPKFETLQKIADALNVKYTDLMDLPRAHDSESPDMTPAEISEDKPVSFPGLEKKVSEIGYSIIYGTKENSDGVDLTPGDLFIQYPDNQRIRLEYSDLDVLNTETDAYLKFRLEELRKKKLKE